METPSWTRVKAMLRLGSETYSVNASKGTLSEQLLLMKEESMSIPSDVPPLKAPLKRMRKSSRSLVSNQRKRNLLYLHLKPQSYTGEADSYTRTIYNTYLCRSKKPSAQLISMNTPDASLSSLPTKADLI
ncbi:hypothetical protein HS088_TW10G00529 [Tripterygium wilfordii]|uniref:Uncharacterized protein n=1 Tax=Tripterygium wilfordii TaxID=458696 RepID=A0A7J7D5H5_TRIWF|nr:hypothetical protein HS088_TW10G00529 [Tripterygium wilfordii]